MLAVLERGGSAAQICHGHDIFPDIRAQFSKNCWRIEAPQLDLRSLRLPDIWRAWRCIRQVRPQVIFYSNPGVPDFLPYLVASRLAGVAHVIAHHGNMLAFPKAVPTSRHLGGLLPGFGLWRHKLVWNARLAARSVTLAMFNNEEQQRSWVGQLRYPRAMTALWFPPIDLSKFCPTPQRRVEGYGARGLRPAERRPWRRA